MAPLFKVTIVGTIDATFYVRAETEDFARDIAEQEIFDDTMGYFKLSEDVEEVEDSEGIDEYEVLS